MTAKCLLEVSYGKGIEGNTWTEEKGVTD